jgi:glycosyltransferase involved in cell wall biosynthesis
VSVIVPTKNRKTLLASTLDSVRAQTWPRWEALVVDDGSDDGTQAFVNDLSLQDARIRLLPRKSSRGGGNRCRNQGLAESGGEFVLFLDSDDLLLPHTLAGRVNFLCERPVLDFAVFQAEAFKTTPGDLRLVFNVDTPEHDIDRLLRLDIPWQTSGPLWRRRALERLGGWDERLSSWQDWEFHLRALCLGLRYEKAAGWDFYWRRTQVGHDSIVAQSDRPEHLAQREYLFARVQAMLASAGELTPLRRTYLAALYFEHGEKLARSPEPRLACRAWTRCWRKGLITAAQYTEGMTYFRAFGNYRARSVLKNYLEAKWSRALLGTLPRHHVRACFVPWVNAPDQVASEALA